jgi:chaperone BCS1
MFETIYTWFSSQITTNMFMGGALGAAALGSILFLSRKLSIFVFEKLIKLFTVDLTVRNDQGLYVDICEFIVDNNLIKYCKSLQLMDSDRNSWFQYDDTGLFTFANGFHLSFYKGLPLFIHKTSNNEVATKGGKLTETLRLIFPLRFNTSILENILLEIRNKKLSKFDSIGVYILSGGGWEKLTNRNLRSLDTIILDDDIKQDLILDLNTFISSKEKYTSKGILYKRGYLFKGKLGTGKTSTVLGLASLLKRNIYSLNLHTLDDKNLIEAFINIPDNAIILLEDIDAMSDATNQRNVSSKDNSSNSETDFMKVSLSTILNVLDGTLSKENSIVIMTSNYPEKLDSALLRKGRVDKIIKFDYFNRELASRMYDLYNEKHDLLEREDYLNNLSYPISCCELQEKLLNEISIIN